MINPAPAQRKPQASTPRKIQLKSATARRDTIGRSRSRISARNEYPTIANLLAMRLVEELPRRQGQCAPRREDMAAELGRDIRTIDRGYKVLEAGGWINRKRGGRYDAVTITLMIPSEGADIHRFGSKKPVGIHDTQVSHMNGSHTRHETAPYATSNASIRDTCVSRHKVQEVQKEQSAASPRASEYADREEETFEQQLDRFKSTRARGALNVPYDDPGYISFDEPRWSGHPTTTVAASS